MEIRIYKSMQHYSSNKSMYTARVECPDAFDYASTLSVFRSIYGSDIVVVFLCV